MELVRYYHSFLKTASLNIYIFFRYHEYIMAYMSIYHHHNFICNTQTRVEAIDDGDIGVLDLPTDIFVRRFRRRHRGGEASLPIAFAF